MFPELPKLKFNLKKYSKTANKRYGALHREAVRQVFRNLIIPVETGMAKATLIGVTELLGRLPNVVISPTRKPYFSKLEGKIQSAQSGRDAATFRLIDDKNNNETMEFIFEFEPNVIHFWSIYKGQTGEDRFRSAAELYRAHVRVNIKPPPTDIGWE